MGLLVQAGPIGGVLLIEPRVFTDPRGHFLEAWNQDRYTSAGLPGTFVQDSVSRSRRGVIRGLHLQWPAGQAKLVHVLEGEIFDVAVDLRRGSPEFGRWVGYELSSANHRQVFIPAGVAHGFCVVSDWATVTYKSSSPYRPEHEITVAWNDPTIAIDWPLAEPTLSEKDAAAPDLDAVLGRLPTATVERRRGQ